MQKREAKTIPGEESDLHEVLRQDHKIQISPVNLR